MSRSGNKDQSPMVAAALSPLMTRSDSRSGLGPSDQLLVSTARQGEAWAQEALFRRHAPMANRVAGRLMKNQPDRDDVVQDAFVEALTHLGRLEDGDAFAAWLRAIVVRTAFKRMRRRRLMTKLGLIRNEEFDLTQVASQGIDAEQAAELRWMYRKIGTLPESEQVPYLLRHVEGLQISEIAEATNVSEATVKRRIRRVADFLSQKDKVTP